MSQAINQGGMMAGMDAMVESEENGATPLANWDRKQVAHMANDVQATERQIEDSVMKKILALPDSQRDDLLGLISIGQDPKKHPLFAQIFQQVLKDLQPHPLNAGPEKNNKSANTAPESAQTMHKSVAAMND